MLEHWVHRSLVHANLSTMSCCVKTMRRNTPDALKCVGERRYLSATVAPHTDSAVPLKPTEPRVAEPDVSEALTGSLLTH